MRKLNDSGSSTVYVLVVFLVLIAFFSVLLGNSNTLMKMKENSYEDDELIYVSSAVKRSVAMSLENIDFSKVKDLCVDAGGADFDSFEYTISDLKVDNSTSITIFVRCSANGTPKNPVIDISYNYNGQDYSCQCRLEDIL